MNHSIPITLDTLTSELPRVGAKLGHDFFKLNIRTVRDLLFHFPFRHEDFSHIVRASDMKIGARATVRVQVLTIENRRSPRQHRLLTEGIFQDDSGSVKAMWFNQPYLPKLLRPGEWIFMSGTLDESPFGVHFTNPVFERLRPDEEAIHAGRLVPIYHTRGSITNRLIRTLVAETLPTANLLTEWLPNDIRRRRNFSTLAEAIRAVHFPASAAALEGARKRLAFDEIFVAQLLAACAHRALDESTAPGIAFDEAATKKFVAALPFALTADQRRATWDILKDLKKPRPMNRLLEGEVGSGKTVVAAIAILNTALAGGGTMYLAPTEILARQHAATLQSLFKKFPVRIGLLTQSMQTLDGASMNRRTLEAKIAAGYLDLVIGTQALLNQRAHHPRTALVIVDEQHRFGVEQRKQLRAERDGTIPHFLSLTATPIPRTLALTAYGDLDISLLRHLPTDRKPITTTFVSESKRKQAYEHIRQEIKAGRQAFVICPLILESDTLGVRAATKEYEMLKQMFPEFHVGLLHGKLKADEKSRVMQLFKENKTQLLVATAVVEVGIDVPNATIMMIEGAQRFGLAQLHQFRGRIGRGVHASHCYVFTDTDAPEVRERLLMFARTRDGFALAEKDLELRGPGQFFGTEQSGFPAFRLANFRDPELTEIARAEATQLLERDPDLARHPLIRNRTDALRTAVHLE